MRKVLLGFAVLLVICAGLFFRFHHSQPPVEVAFAANREVTLQSTTAQVREPVATVNFGDRLEILQRFQDQVQVRTTKGVTGWVSGHELLSADLWQRAADMMQKAGEIPVQAVGHTKTLTNVHVDSGEIPRAFNNWARELRSRLSNGAWSPRRLRRTRPEERERGARAKNRRRRIGCWCELGQQRKKALWILPAGFLGNMSSLTCRVRSEISSALQGCVLSAGRH